MICLDVLLYIFSQEILLKETLSGKKGNAMVFIFFDNSFTFYIFFFTDVPFSPFDFDSFLFG